MKIIFIGFLIRILFSYINVFFGPFSGAEYDAIAFHNEAIRFTQDLKLSDKLGWIYSDIIGIIYLLSTKSIFIGSLVSIFSWTFSAIVILKLLKKFNFDDKIINLILIFYVFLPSSIFLTSITLREATILLFINLIALSFAKYELDKRLLNIFIISLFFIVLIFFHKAYVINAIFIIPILLLIMFFSINNRFILFLLIILMFPLFFYISNINISKDFYDTSSLFYENISNFKSNLTISRATYEINYEINNFIGFLFFAPLTFFRYLFEPMPWRVSSFSDVILFFENCLRFFLIYLAITKLNKINYKTFYFVLFFYFLTELIWSFGTSNWGTAARHHLPSYGLLLLIAFFPNYKFNHSNKNYKQSTRI